jgi:hypothetical protein
MTVATFRDDAPIFLLKFVVVEFVGFVKLARLANAKFIDEYAIKRQNLQNLILNFQNNKSYNHHQKKTMKQVCKKKRKE